MQVSVLPQSILQIGNAEPQVIKKMDIIQKDITNFEPISPGKSYPADADPLDNDRIL